MTTTSAELTIADPLAPASAQFSLTGTTVPLNSGDVASADGLRPWGLRRARLAGPGRPFPLWSYDPRQQKAVDQSGVPLIHTPAMADPTAMTTSHVDGEDAPSSEDWIND